jgi:tripartite-type tricarboxylate transporter receptor subunit TctC
MLRFLVSTALMLLVWCSGQALAQSEPTRGFPAHPLRMIVPFGAGGGTDTIARVLAAKMGESLGQPMIVENKPGAQGIIACELVRKADPDGYTILIATSGPMAANAAIYPKLPYNPVRDFTPITMIGSYPLIMVVNASLPVRSLQDGLRWRGRRISSASDRFIGHK